MKEITFDNRKITPMQLSITEPFDSIDYIYELKLDGARCLAYLDKNSTVLINKRFKDVTDIYPELNYIHKCAKKRCIIDGELVALNDGKPDFSMLMKRSLLNNNFKIGMLCEKIPVNFVVYDILFLNDKDVTGLPLIERKKLLENNIKEDGLLSISRYIEERGIDFFEIAKAQDLEGIVAKLKTSKYYTGKRSKEWFKIKNMKDEDFIICGYVNDEEGNIKDLLFGQYDKNGEICHTASIYTANKFVIKKISEFSIKNKTAKYKNFDVKDAVYIKPQLVCTIEYMKITSGGGMRQPIFKGLREDVTPQECIKIR